MTKRKIGMRALSTSGRLVKSKNMDPSIASVLLKAGEVDSRQDRSGMWSVKDGIEFLLKVEAGDRWEKFISTHGRLPNHLADPTWLLKKEDDEVELPINWFPSLFRTIISAQLAGAAASTIHGRALSAFGVNGDDDDITVEQVLNAEYTLKEVGSKTKQVVNGEIPGLSGQKVKYIRSLAEHFNDPSLLKGVDLQKLTDEDLHCKLTAVTGLGDWSVEMFQIFKLNRQDIFSFGDLAVR